MIRLREDAEDLDHKPTQYQRVEQPRTLGRLRGQGELRVTAGRVYVHGCMVSAPATIPYSLPVWDETVLPVMSYSEDAAIDIVSASGSGSADKVLGVPSDWFGACSALVGSPVVAIVGPRNVGKSTFSRILTNTILSESPEVLYIDTDIGQPEFTCSGVISASLVSSFMLDTPQTRQMSEFPPLASVFIGTDTPVTLPMYYLRALRHLLLQVKNHFRNDLPPVVINTHGWVKGLGLQLVLEIIELWEVTDVVQLSTSSDDRRTDLDYALAPLSCTRHFLYVNRDIPSENLLSSKTYRHMTFANYFHALAPASSIPGLADSLASLAPYRINWKDFIVFQVGVQVANDELLRLLNCSLVALVRTTSKPDSNSSLRTCFIGDEAELFPQFLGMAIIRGIDTVREELHILTPASEEVLRHVNGIARGSLTLPSVLYASSHELPAQPRPYYCPESTHIDIGKSAMKSRNIPRARMLN